MSVLNQPKILLVFLLLEVMIYFSEAKTDSHRFRYHCPICDDFDLETDPSGSDFADVLKEFGYKEENIKQIQESKDAKIDIGHNRKEDNYYLITSNECKKDNKNIFELKKEFMMKLCDGREIPATITSEVDEDREKIELRLTFKGVKGDIIMEFVEGGVLLHFQVNGKKATLKYNVSDRNVIAAKPSGKK